MNLWGTMDMVRTTENHRGKDQLSNAIITYSLIHEGSLTFATVSAATRVDEIRLW
jgi:hypothetical protein